ncbi:MAG: hypothetical protein M3065_08905, partial [Actinomycetota bacterium]|nr:hypothetical protein [Actinomycetota bacterium]
MSDKAPGAARRGQAQRGGARPSPVVTERDHRILAFVAEHRIVLAGHVQALLGVGETVAYRRLAALTARDLLAHDRVLHGQPGWYQITRSGLGMIGSGLPPPRIDLRCYRHDIGVAWVWLAASRGVFGRLERTVSEREMRSRDAARAAADRRARATGAREVDLGDEHRSPFGVHLGGVGPRGQVRLHYPDLLLVGPAGERVAVELELSAKGGRRLETILAGYGADPSIAAVLYLVERPAIAREVRAAAARLGISDLVHVRPLAWGAEADPSATARARASGRGVGRAAAAGRGRAAGRATARSRAPAR